MSVALDSSHWVPVVRTVGNFFVYGLNKLSTNSQVSGGLRRFNAHVTSQWHIKTKHTDCMYI